MRRVIPSCLILFGTLVMPTLTEAQTVTAPWSPTDPARLAWSPRDLSTGDAHRLEMERLRAANERSRILAAEQTVQTRQSLETIQARRGPTPPTPPARVAVPPAPPLPPAADTRRIGSTGQIDTWLDRPN